MYKEQIEAYFADKESTLVEAVGRLVSIDSTEGTPAPGAPFGPGPAAALDEALKLAAEWGLNVHNHEGYVGTADLNGEEDALHILGHLDVVSPGEGWTVTKPFAPKLVIVQNSDGAHADVTNTGDASNTMMVLVRPLRVYRAFQGFYTARIIWEGNTVSWYSDGNHYAHMNTQGKVYTYVALG